MSMIQTAPGVASQAMPDIASQAAPETSSRNVGAAALPAALITDLSFSYGGDPVLSDVSLRVEAGDFLALIGPNGGGKTTLIRLMLGLLNPVEGEVRLFGHSPRSMGGRVGYVPQFSTMRPDFPASVLEMVLMGGACPSLFGGGWDRSGPARKKALSYLDSLGLADVAAHPIAALSGGQRQRAMVARALMSRPEFDLADHNADFLLLLDEPTASTDQEGRYCFYEFLGNLRGSITLVVVSHDLFNVSPFFSRAAFVNKTLTPVELGELSPENLALLFGHHQQGCPVADMLFAGGGLQQAVPQAPGRAAHS
jgi:zinc transport system ATP-binding protein